MARLFIILTVLTCAFEPSGAAPKDSAPDSMRRPTQAAPALPLRDQLRRQLEDVAQSVSGLFSYAIVDLATGERLGRLEDSQFATASTIKLAILYELFRQVEEGRLSLDDMRPLDRRHVVAGTGILRELAAPAMPLRDYATLMIVLSDNTATNVLIEAVGMDRVTARMAALGLSRTMLRRRMIDLEAARRGNENVSTAAEIARLLEIIHKGEGLSQTSQRELLAILKKPKSTPIRRGVPPAVAIAGKPGTLEGVAVDAAIVYVEGRPFIFSAMAVYLRNDEEGDAAIERASRLVFEYFDRVARSSEYGRRIRD